MILLFGVASLAFMRLANNMKKAILQIIPSMGVGGVEQAVLGIVPAIKEAGFMPLVVSEGGVSVPEIESLGGRHILFPAGSKNLFSFYFRVRALRRIIKDNNVVLVHARSRVSAWLAYYAVRGLEGVKFVTSMHGAHSLGGRLKRHYNSAMVRGDRIFTVSHFMRSHILENYGDYISADLVSVIYDGIDLVRFDNLRASSSELQRLRGELGLGIGRRLLVMVGRATRLKGHDLVFDAFCRLREDVDLDLLFVVPNVADMGDWVKRAEAEGLGDRFFVRSVVGDDLPLVYALGDICLVGSKVGEAFGLVTVESQSMGGLVIVPNSGACPELVIDGVSGFLYGSCDVDDLVGVVRKVLGLSDAERDKIRKEAVKSSKNFGTDINRKKVIEFYEEVINL